MKQKFILPFILLGISILWTGCNFNPQGQDGQDTSEPLELGEQDEYFSFRDTLSFRSKDMEHDAYNGDYYYYSQQAAAIDWPLKLADCENIAPLHQALINYAFPKADPSTPIATCIKEYTERATFLDFIDDIEAIRINNDEMEGGMNCYTDAVSVHVSMASPSLLTFVIGHYSYTGGAHGFYMDTYVNFDKKNGKIFDTDETFRKDSKDKVIQVLNHYIKQKQDYYEPTTEIPTFYFGPENLTFVFAPYAIACYAEGIVKVSIPYTALDAYLTDEIKEILKDASQFVLVNQ